MSVDPVSVDPVSVDPVSVDPVSVDSPHDPVRVVGEIEPPESVRAPDPDDCHPVSEPLAARVHEEAPSDTIGGCISVPDHVSGFMVSVEQISKTTFGTVMIPHLTEVG